MRNIFLLLLLLSFVSCVNEEGTETDLQGQSFQNGEQAPIFYSYQLDQFTKETVAFDMEDPDLKSKYCITGLDADTSQCKDLQAHHLHDLGYMSESFHLVLTRESDAVVNDYTAHAVLWDLENELTKLYDQAGILAEDLFYAHKDKIEIVLTGWDGEDGVKVDANIFGIVIETPFTWEQKEKFPSRARMALLKYAQVQLADSDLINIINQMIEEEERQIAITVMNLGSINNAVLMSYGNCSLDVEPLSEVDYQDGKLIVENKFLPNGDYVLVLVEEDESSTEDSLILNDVRSELVSIEDGEITTAAGESMINVSELMNDFCPAIE